MTFDLDLWPTDLAINRDYLLIKDYLPIKFEAFGAKCCWVISCTRFERLTWPLTLTFDLLTWLSIGIIYSPRTIYLPSFWGKAFWSYQLHKVKGYRHTDRPTDIPTYRPTCATQYAPPSSKGGIKIAQFMSKTICGKTYDIGYIYLWSIRERDFIFGMHSILKLWKSLWVY